MKIVILVRILWTAGAPKKAIREAKELLNMGHEVELIFLRKSVNMKGYDDILAGINYRIITNQNKSIFVPLFDYITGLFAPDRKGDGRLDYNLIRHFPSYISKSPPNYIICHDQFSGLAGFYAMKKLGVPYSVLMHERVNSTKSGLLSKLADRYISKVLKKACSVIASTDKIAETVRSKYHVACTTNYQGFDKLEFKRYTERENILMAISMWDIGRKPTVYLDVLEGIPAYKLYIVGNWRSEKLFTDFCNEVDKRNLSSRVIILRNVSEYDLNTLYDRTKFVIRFGFGEFGESHAFFEGLQRGVPIIMNSDLGSSELAKKYLVGLVMDKIDISTIREFLLEYDNDESYTKLQANINKIIADYTWESHARKLVDCLENTPK